MAVVLQAHYNKSESTFGKALLLLCLHLVLVMPVWLDCLLPLSILGLYAPLKFRESLPESAFLRRAVLVCHPQKVIRQIRAVSLILNPQCICIMCCQHTGWC